MKTNRMRNPIGAQANGIAEVLVVIATIVLLAIIAPLVFSRPRGGQRYKCFNNLRQMGLAARMWSSDHEDLFPWNVPASSNGVKEIATSGNIAALFLCMTSELNSPKILYCPTDGGRQKEGDFAKLENNNISYFVGLDAEQTKPQTILFGDRNISGGIVGSNRVMSVSKTNVLVWGADIHGQVGNIAMADGSAEQVDDKGLRKQTASQAALKPLVRFALP